MVTVNTKIEVTRNQYKILVSELSGIVAHKSENGKYYIKCLLSKYCPFVDMVIQKF